MLTEKQYRKAIALARGAGACSEAMDIIETLTVDEFVAHPEAPGWCYWYVGEVINGRWPEAEDIIGRDYRYAYRYANHVIGGRWPEVEEVIRGDPWRAYLYAKYVIGGRWPEAEEVIRRDPEYASLYSMTVTTGRWGDE